VGVVGLGVGGAVVGGRRGVFWLCVGVGRGGEGVFGCCAWVVGVGG